MASTQSNKDVTEDAPSTCQALIQIAKSAGDDVVSIPADVLVSLLSNMLTMQLQLGGLRLELTTVKEDLRTLEAASGMTFLRFEKLPLEIRRMIWRIALSKPHVIDLRTFIELSSAEARTVMCPNSYHLRALTRCVTLVLSRELRQLPCRPEF